MAVPLHKPGHRDDDAAESREEFAQRLSVQHASADALEILRSALTREFPGRIAIVSSFGAESAVLLHLVAQIDPATPVLFLDTGKHFAQTLSYRKSLSTSLGLRNVRVIAPNAKDVDATDPSGELWKRDTEACCQLRKVNPLTDVLGDFDAWITGRKAFHSDGRARLPAFEATVSHIKVNPLVRWSPHDVDQYFQDHDLPRHPLVDQGYPSIGCWPCTHPVAPGEDIRAGRWRGAAKTECGIHART